MHIHNYDVNQMKLTVDVIALIALRCLGLLFIQIKTKKAEGDIPFLLVIRPVSL